MERVVASGCEEAPVVVVWGVGGEVGGMELVVGVTGMD